MGGRKRKVGEGDGIGDGERGKGKRKRGEKDGDIRAAMRVDTKPEAKHDKEGTPSSSPLHTTHPTAASPLPPSATTPSPDPLALIASSGLSSFRQRVLRALTQVPCGQHTTYAALAAHLGSAPRAVGNAMRNNPFAPAVPCHRVLAADGGIGGFGGEWGGREGKEGERIRKKRELLRGEGVRFDGKGRVLGGVWRGFV